MTPDALLRSMLLTFPERTNRVSLLMNAFSASASMHWKNGEIVCEFNYDAWRNDNPVALTPQAAYDLAVSQRNERRTQQIASFNSDRIDHFGIVSAAHSPMAKAEHDRIWKEAVTEAETNAYVYDNVDAIIADGSIPERMHDIDYKCLLLTMPDDVTDAWLDAGEELCRALQIIPHSFRVTDEDLNPQSYNREAAIRQSKVTHRLLEQYRLTTTEPTDEEIGLQLDDWQHDIAVEHQQRIDADRAVVAAHRILGQNGLVRIAAIRAKR